MKTTSWHWKDWISSLDGFGMKTWPLFVLVAAGLVGPSASQEDDYYYDEDYGDSAEVRSQKYSGAYVGTFSSHHHQVSGKLFVVDEKTLLLKQFTYDGQGRDAFFLAGSDGSPSHTGFLVPNEFYRTNVLQRYFQEIRKKD